MKKISFFIFLILSVAWMTVIFLYSSKDAGTSTVSSYRVGRMVGRLFIPGFDEMSEEEQTEFASRIDKPVRKTAHGCEYAVLGFFVAGAVLSLGSTVRPKKIILLLIAWAFCVLYAVSDEVHQYFVPGRACRFFDMCIDSAGAAVGVAAQALLNRILKRKL